MGAKVTKLNTRTTKPAADPVAREKQLINLAVDLAEKQLMEGTASPSVINHFLKRASTREVIEMEILEKQSELIGVKAAAIINGKDAENTAKAAIEAMKSYSSKSE